MAEFDLIIFDCDGTLVDSEYLGHYALEIKLRDMGIEEHASKIMAEHRGGKLTNITRSLEIKHDIVLDDDFILSFRKLLVELFNNELKEIKGVTKALQKITKPICVASGGPLEKIEQSLSITKLKRFFGDNIFSSYEVNSWKPEPGLFLHAAEEMSFKPEQCVVVEDSPIGIEAALAANMTPIFYDPLNLTLPFKGVMTIKHMRELESALNSIL